MSENFPQFGAFDPEAEVDVSARNLPHWFQPGVAVFITMRCLDSMPGEVIELWSLPFTQSRIGRSCFEVTLAFQWFALRD